MKYLLGILFACSSVTLYAQQQPATKWNLKSLVEYAMKNNISVKQAEVQARIAALQHKANQLAVYPNANFSAGGGMQFGRSIDPTTNQFTQTQLLFNSFNFNTGMVLYNWGRLKNTTASSNFALQANIADIERAANDIGLNVATFYLAVLSSKQQVEIANTQIALTQEQLINTREKVAVGALPELNTIQLEAKLAQDSISYYNALNSLNQNIINLKALLNLDMATPFEVEMPTLDKIPVEPLAELDPAVLYKLALTNQPQQKVAELRMKSADYAIKAAKAALYPTISLGGGVATNFANSTRKITGVNLGPAQPTGQFVTVGSNTYPVLEPSFTLTQGKKTFGEMWDGYGLQLDNNFRQNIGLQINIPIFNNGSARLNYENSKLQLQQANYAKAQVDLKLQQDIYTAHANALAALQRYNASEKSVDAAQRSYNFAVKRYDVGLINTLDLITTQNNLLQAKLNMLNNQFEYIFRIKLLEFYRGNGLKLN